VLFLTPEGAFLDELPFKGVALGLADRRESGVKSKRWAHRPDSYGLECPNFRTLSNVTSSFPFWVVMTVISVVGASFSLVLLGSIGGIVRPVL
jgi:hypothetical protein